MAHRTSWARGVVIGAVAGLIWGGCASQPAQQPGDAGDAATLMPEVTLEAMPEAAPPDSPPPPPLPPVWTSDSAGFRLEQITCGAGCLHQYYETSKPSARQLAVLSTLALEPGNGTCSTDGASANLTVIDQNGVERTFFWRDRGESCGVRAVLGNRPYRSLVATVPACYQVASEIPRGGCMTSIFLGGTPKPQTFTVGANESHVLAMTDCDVQVVLVLKDPSGQMELARGVRDGRFCSRLEHQFSQAGIYQLTWEGGSPGAALLGADPIR